MNLWSYKPGEWVNLDQVVKVVLVATTTEEPAFVTHVQTRQTFSNPKAGQKREERAVTLYMSNNTIVPIKEAKAVDEIVRRLKLGDPTSPPSPEDAPPGTPSP
jgi:hypothetical protein